MSDSVKSVLDLMSGPLTDISAAQRALEAQGLPYKTTSDLLSEDAVCLAALSLNASEVEKAMAIASDKIAMSNPYFKDGELVEDAKLEALRLNDPLENFCSMHGAIPEAIKNSSKLSPTLGGAVGLMSSLISKGFNGPYEDRVAKTLRMLTESDGGVLRGVRAPLGLNGKELGALSRTQHWADVLARGTVPDYAGLLGTGNRYRDQFGALNLAANNITNAMAGIGESAGISATLRRLAGLETTATKMSLFAGAIDILGPGAGASQAAYQGLMGNYSSTEMLERRYWHNPLERERYYRDQQVDDGLIDGNNAATVETLIESGVVEGRLTRAGTMTAVIEAGPIKLRIIASRTKSSAFIAITDFEIALRAFVSAKLKVVAGPNWFKERVPGDVIGRAKNRRREALRAGEVHLPLIHYTDLGDLIGVILRKDNWSELFEAVFGHAEWLRVDLERLNAHRRPTMHARPIEPVQLCEIVFTIRRLSNWIERDGVWDMGWDEDI
jgi:hypothetical protein